MTPDMPKVELGRPATYDDLVALPEHLVGEIVDDELWASPRPAPRHATTASRLGARLGMAFDSSGGAARGWRIISEPELHLGKHTLVPDIAGWRLARMPRLPQTAYFPLAPDWVCEVLSGSTARLDRARKLPMYAEHGVRHAWVVDPILRTLEVLRLDTGRWTLSDTRAGDVSVRAEPFEDLELRLGELWDGEVVP